MVGGFNVGANNNTASSPTRWGTTTTAAAPTSSFQNATTNASVGNHHNNTTKNIVQQQQQLTYAMEQSPLVRYLVELDHAYDAVHPDCKFRTFLYNMCSQGQTEQAIEREKNTAAQLGGAGAREEQLILARGDNPDPNNMFPTATHFMVGLFQHGSKQKQALSLLMNNEDSLKRKVKELNDANMQNAAMWRDLSKNQILLERLIWDLTQQKEQIRLWGVPLAGQEKFNLEEQVVALKDKLNAPGQFRSPFDGVVPFLQMQTNRKKDRKRERENEHSPL